jgi:8-oxo-dGTP pyrophosphatase MutT (NUDIX family)
MALAVPDATSDAAPVRDAATVILIRNPRADAQILMGQRGARAAFMPSKFVFPGGVVDRGDAAIPLASDLPKACQRSLSDQNSGTAPATLAAAAIREVFEETGLILGRAADWQDAPPDWRGFAATGHRPAADALSFVFRAITPPGRPRRFDARFFLADAACVASDPDDFSAASDELSHLAWVPLADARRFDLPFITEVVLAEVASRLPSLSPPDQVPFFRNDDEESLFLRLGGVGPLD